MTESPCFLSSYTLAEYNPDSFSDVAEAGLKHDVSSARLLSAWKKLKGAAVKKKKNNNSILVTRNW